MRREIMAAGLAVLLAACGTTATDEQIQATVAQVPSGMVEVDLSTHGLLGRLMVPGKQKTGVDPTVTEDPATSYLNIRSGKNYNVLVREEPLEMESIKTDLADEMMFKNEVVLEQPNSILYRRSLPDGSQEFYHFATIVDENGQTVLLKSNGMGEYSQKQAERMMESSLTFSLKAPLAVK